MSSIVLNGATSASTSSTTVSAAYEAPTPSGLTDASQHPALLELAAALQQLQDLKQGRPVTAGPPKQPAAGGSGSLSVAAAAGGSPLTSNSTGSAAGGGSSFRGTVDWGRFLDVTRPEESGKRLTTQIANSNGSVVGLAARLSSPLHLAIIKHIERPARDKIRDDVLQLVLKSLTSGSKDYLVAASMLAELVHLELVNLSGVATALENLLGDPSTRKAACAVLGKISQQAKSNEALKKAMNHLNTIVNKIEDPELEYDVCYISRTMGWSKQPKAALHQVRTLSTPHKGSIISSAFFPQRDELVTGGADGTIAVWGAPSFGDVPSAQFTLPPHTIPCGMDAAKRGNMLAVAVAPTDGKAPQVHLYPVLEVGGKFGSSIKVNRPIGSVVTGLKCISSKSSSYCISECSAKGAHNVVFFGGSNADQVTRDISEVHDDYVTALSTSAPETLLTGSRDGSVKLWDCRSANKPAAATSLRSHTSAVTTLEPSLSQSWSLLTGSLDKKLSLWDLRKVGNGPVTERTCAAPVLKVSQGPKNTALVATTNSLGVMTLPSLVMHDITPNVCYHQLRQNTESSVVYAMGEERVVDMYSLEIASEQ